ncbi:hypothetical protein CEN44_20470 [Fischerella muscicola CCMEE 5323]|uniref:Uncharacterized protein n=2 Tax=Fischerella muscicola TaxID=92938 RepID=A0A2N6JYS9_FISMU|nr:MULTISPECIES: hypothetical protein [Fischerella]PLZ86186.1 hypothetical protein CEN44_20470 [Fischerella muscicola CCMEE 5323]
MANGSALLIGAKFNKKQSLSQTISTDFANTTPAISLVSLDLPTGRQAMTSRITPKTFKEIPPTKVDKTDIKTETTSLALYTEPTERITGLTALSNGTFVIVSTALTREGNYNKLLFFDNQSSKSKKISELKKSNCTIENLLATKDDKLIGIVSLNGGIPPFEMIIINPKNGKVSSGSDLSLPELLPDRRFSNLALSPDGRIYATTLRREGITRLVQLDLDNRSMITGKGNIVTLSLLMFDEQPLQNDLLSLTFSPSGEVYALADPKNEGTNFLFSVDIETGEMKPMSMVAVDKITFSRKSISM